MADEEVQVKRELRTINGFTAGYGEIKLSRNPPRSGFLTIRFQISSWLAVSYRGKYD